MKIRSTASAANNTTTVVRFITQLAVILCKQFLVFKLMLKEIDFDIN